MIEECVSPSAGRRKNVLSNSAWEENADATAKNYSDEALAENQPLVGDLIPKRVWWLSLLLVVGLAAIAGLEYLYQLIDIWSNSIGREKLAALDVAAQGSIASWYGSLLLLLAAVGSAQVYSLRRYKIDDYRGRYRIWLWATFSLALACLAAATPLHQLIGGLLTYLTGTILYGNVAFWWISAYTIIFGTLLLRMLVEVRHSRTAFASLFLAAVGYVIAIGIELKLIAVQGVVQAVTVQSSATLLAHLGVSFAVAVYARYVFLDAQGMLPVRIVKSKEEPLKDEPQSSDSPESALTRKRRVRIDTSHADKDSTNTEATTPKRSDLVTASIKKLPSPQSVAPAAQQEDEPPEGRQLSKSERKRLRKLKRKQLRQNT